MGALLGRRLAATIDLGVLERALIELGLGTDLAAALDALGFAVDPLPAQRRAARLVAEDARTAARAAAADWPEEWAAEWIGEVIRAGILGNLDLPAALQLVASVRKVIDRLDPAVPGLGARDQAGPADARADPVSRVDLAATTLGSSHALDTGTRLEAATTRALVRMIGHDDARDVWERAGAHTDLVSGPALTWRLPIDPISPLSALAVAAADAGVPLYLTQFALRRHVLTVPAGSIIHVAENPRVVEAAAQRNSDRAIFCTNGNPSGAVRLLVDQLLTSGAELHYHGDFDAAGLAICARMQVLGMAAWAMTADHYRLALADADADGVDLPIDVREAGPTPWDPELRTAFNQGRRIVHEERLLDQLLTD